MNSASLIRFEMDDAAQKLPAQERYSALTVRSSPLPRRTGDIDREQMACSLHAGSTHIAKSEPKTEVERELVRIFRLFKPGVSIDPEMNLELNLGFDSLERIQLIVAVEEQFSIEISDDDAVQFFTCGDLTDYLETRLQISPNGDPGVRF